MSEKTFLRGDSILVPVSLNPSCKNKDLVSWLVLLARMMDKSVRLVHVLQSWVNVPVQLPYGENTKLFNLKDVIQSSIRSQAEAELAELTALFPKDVQVSTKIREGQVVESILAEATDDGTSMLVIPLAQSPRPWVWLEGYSTPFSILAKSSVPVMVIHCQAPLLDLNKPQNLLLLDDLRIHTEPAVQGSFELLSHLPQAELHHLHVCDLNEDQIRFALEQGGTELTSKLGASLCVDDILQDACCRLEAQLSERSRHYVPCHSMSERRWQQKVLVGQVCSQVKNYINFFRPDLIIVGRHHALQQRPFKLGQMTYRMMIEEDRPLLMIPNRD